MKQNGFPLKTCGNVKPELEMEFKIINLVKKGFQNENKKKNKR